MPATISKRRALKALAFSALSLSLGLHTGARAADAYPSKPVKLIVPFAAGGSTDVVARLIAEGMRTTLGQSVIVDNKAGAGGLLGTEALAQAAPDGYTVGMATVSTLTVNPSVYTRGQSVVSKVTPVANLVTVPGVYSVHPKLGVNTLDALIAKAKEQPGKISVAVPGLGTLGHLMVASFAETYKIDIQVVPYRGNGPAMNDALAGLVDVMPDQLPSSIAYLKAGKLIPLVQASNGRSPDLPNVATFKELGQDGLNQMGISWFGLIVPKNTPAPIVKQLQEAATKAVRLPQVRERLKSLGAVPTEMDQSQFPEQIAQQTRRHKVLVEKVGVKPE